MYAMFNVEKIGFVHFINTGQQRNQVIKYEILLFSVSIDAYLHAGKNTLLFKADQLLTFLVRTLLIPSYPRRNRVNLANTFQFLKEYLKKEKLHV